jgi:hypothetical protein
MDLLQRACLAGASDRDATWYSAYSHVRGVLYARAPSPTAPDERGLPVLNRGEPYVVVGHVLSWLWLEIRSTQSKLPSDAGGAALEEALAGAILAELDSAWTGYATTATDRRSLGLQDVIAEACADRERLLGGLCQLETAVPLMKKNADLLRDRIREHRQDYSRGLAKQEQKAAPLRARTPAAIRKEFSRCVGRVQMTALVLGLSDALFPLLRPFAEESKEFFASPAGGALGTAIRESGQSDAIALAGLETLLTRIFKGDRGFVAAAGWTRRFGESCLGLGVI